MTQRRTHGYDVIDFAEQVCGVELFPWQQWLLVHGLELLPDRSFRFRNIVVLAARQNGKSILSQVLALWFMYRYGVGLVLGTAQDLDTAEDVWQGAVDLVDDVPELRELRARVVLNNGKKALILKSGSRYKVKAANRRAGRGMSGDLILLDELREHQSWDAWAACTKTTMAREFAQVWALSNAGDASSVVLRYLRKVGHAALGDPDGINKADDPSESAPVADSGDEDALADEDTLALFEWSAPPGCDHMDRDGWAQANPSMGYSITERTVASAARTDPAWVFGVEVLCQWRTGSVDGPFPADTWEAGQRVPAASSIEHAAQLTVGLDVSHDRSFAHLSFAGLNAAGEPHVEMVASRAGTEWVVPWLTERAARRPIVAVALQGKGAPVSPLAADLEAAGLPVQKWEGADLTAGTGQFYDLVRAGTLRHLFAANLDVAAATASTRPAGDRWLWDRRNSPNDIAPLIAANAAVWALLNQPVKRVSVYEDNAELIIA